VSNPGAKPNPSPTVRAIVRYGLTTENRQKLLDGNDTVIRALLRAGYSAQTIAECIDYAHEMRGERKAA
jgi:SOS response regulatory protein OraA/RecX